MTWGLRLAFAAAFLAALWGLHHYIDRGGYERAQAEHAAALAVENENNRELGRIMQRAADHVQEKKDAQNRAIADRLSAALVELQNRPDRRSDATAETSPCKGASGAELSVRDSAFLEGQAARGDRLRAALSACYEQYDAVKMAP